VNYLKTKLYSLLRWSERYAKTDMVYLAKSGFWLAAGQTAASVASFVGALAFANFVSPEEYGLYRYVLSIAALLAIPTMSGATTAVIKSIAQGKDGAYAECFKDKLTWGMFGSVVGIAFSAILLINGDYPLAVSLFIASVFVPFMEAYSLYDSILQGRRDFRYSSVTSSISQLIAMAATVTTLFFYPNVIAITLSYFLSWTIVRIIFTIIVLRRTPLGDEPDPGVKAYSRHLSFMNIVSIVANYIDRILLFNVIGPVGLAQYSIALAAPEQMKGLLKQASSLALPNYSKRTYEGAVAGILHKSGLLFLASLAASIVYCIFARDIFQLVFPQYMDAVFYSQVFVLSLPSIISSLPTAIFQANGMTKELYSINVWGSILQIASLVVGVTYAGILGAILARFATRYIQLVLVYWLLFNRRPLSRNEDHHALAE
jgi:O-antigen/teichoic acid export membrane protein